MTSDPDKLSPQEPIAWADRIAFESAMASGKGCDVWPKRGDSTRDLMPLYAAPSAGVVVPLDLFNRIHDYFWGRADIKDGDDGRPEANEAMVLYEEIDAIPTAIKKATA